MSVSSDVDRITGAVTTRQSAVLRLFVMGAASLPGSASA